MAEAEQSIGAVVVAAGTGSRIADGDPTPKQFRSVGGRTVLAMAVEPFVRHGCVPVVVVVGAGFEDSARTALGDLAQRVTLVLGGADRLASAVLGLEACEADLVHVHDAARPFVSAQLIASVESTFLSGKFAGVVPVLPVTDTVKVVDGLNVTASPNRETLRLAQTPQLVSRADYLRSAIALADNGKRPTDDVGVLEAVGLSVGYVQGDARNIKITTAADLDRLQPHKPAGDTPPDLRVGHGYDTHRTTTGDTVWLCGVSVPAPFRLDGHSDADVGLHALTDALLGTCGAGDIGDHFPPSDPQWAGAASDQFLDHARALVSERGGRITNVDVTLVCESPKIGPYRMKMRETIAGIIRTDPERVSVKATTNERVGFIGRNEGIAALATATVLYG